MIFDAYTNDKKQETIKSRPTTASLRPAIFNIRPSTAHSKNISINAANGFRLSVKAQEDVLMSLKTAAESIKHGGQSSLATLACHH